MKIAGSGRIEGGKIEDELVVAGSGHINDNFECNGLRLAGSLSGPGGFIVHGDIRSSGSFHIGGFLQGDNDAKFSGSASIGKAVNLKGALVTSGSFRAGNDVSALSGLKSSGSARVSGDILSDKEISLVGSARVSGNVQGGNVLIGAKAFSLGKRLFGMKGYHYRVYGNIKAKTNVEILNTRVVGDIVGHNVKIDEYSYVKGNVYYVENIEIHPKAKILTKPVQIGENDLDRLLAINQGD